MAPGATIVRLIFVEIAAADEPRWPTKRSTSFHGETIVTAGDRLIIFDSFRPQLLANNSSPLAACVFRHVSENQNEPPYRCRYLLARRRPRSSRIRVSEIGFLARFTAAGKIPLRDSHTPVDRHEENLSREKEREREREIRRFAALLRF